MLPLPPSESLRRWHVGVIEIADKAFGGVGPLETLAFAAGRVCFLGRRRGCMLS